METLATSQSGARVPEREASCIKFVYRPVPGDDVGLTRSWLLVDHCKRRKHPTLALQRRHPQLTVRTAHLLVQRQQAAGQRTSSTMAAVDMLTRAALLVASVQRPGSGG